jgi:hypothetical protein
MIEGFNTKFTGVSRRPQLYLFLISIGGLKEKLPPPRGSLRLTGEAVCPWSSGQVLLEIGD